MITDILICEPDCVGMPSGEAIWAPDAPRLEYRNVDNILLASLWRTLNSDESGAKLEGMDYVVWPDAMPMIFRIPTDLTKRLGALKEEEIRSTASRWAADHNAQLEGLTPDAAQFGLEALSKFAKKAIDLDEPLSLAMYF